MSEFWELYKRPEWQQMRLRVMERENFTCEWCGSTSNTLNVHHTYYVKNMAPWEYPHESMRCFCEGCHGRVTELMLTLKMTCGRLSERRLNLVIGYAMGAIPPSVFSEINLLYGYGYDHEDLDNCLIQRGIGFSDFHGISDDLFIDTLSKSGRLGVVVSQDVRAIKSEKLKIKSDFGSTIGMTRDMLP
jgi:hypothetical protein